MNAVVTSQSFQERLFEKIKTDMGSLMTEEDMKKLVETSIERIYFTGKKGKQSNYPYNEFNEPPEILTIVKAAVEEQVKEQVKNYIGEHADLYKKTIEDTIAKGFTLIAITTIQNLMNAPLQTMLATFQAQMFELVSKLQQKGINL